MGQSHLRLYRRGKELYDFRISNYSVIGFASSILLLVLSIINIFAGSGTLYLIIVTVHFLTVLLWIGLVMLYIQEKARERTAN